MDMVLIWSEEHGAWWAPGARGYTRSMEEAGCYPRPIAEGIVGRANIGGQFHEIIVPIPEGLDALTTRLNGMG